MRSIECAKQKIRLVVAGSQVPEDSRHADNTLEWLLRLEPHADDALQLAALAHDIDRAIEELKVKRADFDDYDTFKAAHARNGAEILRPILTGCGVERHIVDEACRLVVVHEVGGEFRSDLLKDADSISYFDVNLPFYYRRRVGTKPSGDHPGAIGDFPRRRKKSSSTSFTKRKRQCACCER